MKTYTIQFAASRSSQFKATSFEVISGDLTLLDNGEPIAAFAKGTWSVICEDGIFN
jgi:hypothetical protein